MIKDRIKELRRVKASDLVPNPKNWRTHPQHQMDAIRGVLKEVGFAGAELAREMPDGSLMLIDGHARAQIAGDAVIPVLVLDVTEAEADKLLATYDPLSAMAETDSLKLESLLSGVQFHEQALTDMLSELAEQSINVEQLTAGIDTEEEVPETPSVPITKQGDMWILGSHRLLCGDSQKVDHVTRLLTQAGMLDMVLTDPPYGVSYVGKTKDALKVENDDLEEAKLSGLVCKVFDNAQANCRPGAYWYATVPSRPLHILFADDWKRRGILRQIMVWAKNSMVMGHSEYHYQHEPILFGWIPGKRHKNTDRTRTTLWQCDKPHANREHPTMKPVALWERAINDGSRKGELVYDPFLGSGTTIIAAENLGRRCYGIELSPHYCDVIVKRWENATGQKAHLCVDF